ncbi:MAG: glycogen synthase GlgA [Armatimonadota bacterium]|nr:glycogen synthase GlgA [Armatimonadota bacterium]
MRVLFVSNEVAPFAKVGGLADVAGSLPPAIAAHGPDIRVVMPQHRSCPADEQCAVALPSLSVQSPGQAHVCQILQTRLPGSEVPVYLIKYDPFFDRPDVYGPGGTDYPDSPQRYAFFARAALALNRAIGFRADVIHANDWPTGLIPAFQELNPLGSPTLFTIHNLGYQGRFPLAVAPAIDVDPASRAMRLLQYRGEINYLAAALKTATVINTVSERYAEEIQTTAFGERLDQVLRRRSDRLHGVLNGIDYDYWNPSTDQALPATYSAGDLSGKVRCKAAVQKLVGLPVDDDAPLVSAVSRLADQKGLDMLADVLPHAIGLPIQFVLLGTGEPALEERFRRLAKAHPESIAACITYNEDLARQIYAGADMFVMPSRYEPCGLGQMMAMAYGTVPVVHSTGGLADTVTERGPRQSGFVFHCLEIEEMMAALDRAVRAWRAREQWAALVRTCMKQRFSWSESARRYVSLYEEAMRLHP